jgi:hypothetical protein
MVTTITKTARLKVWNCAMLLHGTGSTMIVSFERLEHSCCALHTHVEREYLVYMLPRKATLTVKLLWAVWRLSWGMRDEAAI